MTMKRRKTGAKWIDPRDIPPEPPNLNRQLARIVHANAVANPDLVTRAWYTAIYNCMIPWHDPRRSVVSTTAFQDSVEFVADSGGIYYEGLLLREADHGRPQTAIWISTPEELVCYTHDLSMPHALAGIPLSDTTLSALFHAQGIHGPYLFSKAPGVLDTAVSPSLQTLGGGSIDPRRFQ